MSQPLAAITLLGIVRIRSGSTMDAVATSAGLRNDFLSPLSGLVMTAKPLASDPVPKVVGTRMSGRALSEVRSP